MRFRFFSAVVLMLFIYEAALAQKLASDIPYVRNGHERHVLDVYTPEEPAKKSLPVMFWIHGGGWQKGDKSDVALKPKVLTVRDFVFVSTNYRLLPEVTMEELTSDVARSIGWVHKNISGYGGDPKRIFVGGHSAGAQLAALICTDNRYLKMEGMSFDVLEGRIAVDGGAYDVPKAIMAAAPACYLTTYRRLIETVGAQDAKQNIFGQIAFGMDEPDYVMMQTPKPTLICAATRDVTFDIGDTWDLFRQAKRFYTRMGFAERVDMIEADARHGFTILLRTASVRFMRRWLLGKDDVIHEINPLTDEVMREHQYSADWTDEELLCSPDGQVMLMKSERSVFEINAGVERKLRKRRRAAWEKLNSDQHHKLIRKTIGVVEFARIPSALDGKQGILTNPTTVQRDGYRIKKLVLAGNEIQLTLPGLLFVPETISKPPVLYLHGESMKAEAQPGGRCEQLAKAGHIVLSAELSGIGETETGHDKRAYGRGLFGPDSQEIYLACLMGRSFVGMRTTDVIRWSDFLSRYGSNEKPIPIQMIATGEAAIPALHAAALEASRFESVRLNRMIRSWAEVVAAPESKNQLVNAVHGALRDYNLPDLVELAGKEELRIEEPINVVGSHAFNQRRVI